VVLPDVDQGKEKAKAKKKKSSKKQRHFSGEEQQLPNNMNGCHDVLLGESDAKARTSSVSDQHDPTSGDRLDQHPEGHLRLLGPLPSLTPPSCSRRASQLDSDRPPESYRRLSDCDDDPQEPPNGSALPDTGTTSTTTVSWPFVWD